MRVALKYETLERISLPSPIDRLSYIAELCRGKRVLDIGCYDETALAKRNTQHWLHGRIGVVAKQVIGVDSSPQVPLQGIRTGPNSTIHSGNGIDPHVTDLDDAAIDVIVAGEFIEHIEELSQFFANMKRRFPGRTLLVSTPNGLAFSNVLLGTIGREAQHPDHVHLFTFKILNTLCDRAGFADWKTIPYRFYATEMILGSRGMRKLSARCAEPLVRLVEKIFPLLSFGYVVQIIL